MDGYSVHKVIGEGSFGRALLVQSRINRENYVMKEILLPKTQSKMANTRREAVLLSRMKHPSIVAFRDSFEGDGHLYIVMEFCGGGDLLQRIQRQRNTLFSQETILKWFAQMCSGTMHIHDKRVLHRDLKSKNIFLTDDGTVKLGDFGSACVLNSAKAYAHTYVGTPYYVSPEIWDSKPYNNKSDVWSLGCVLYELCTLRHPFQAPSWKSLIMKVCRGSYPPLPQHLPYELHYLVKQMFKTNPKDRPSLHTILTSHRVAGLLHRHLPNKESERRTGRWRREEGEKVASLLGQKTLITSSTLEGLEICVAPTEAPTEAPAEATAESSTNREHRGPRRQWAPGPSDTALQVLANTDLLSSGSLATTGQTHSGEDPLVGPLSRGGRDDTDGPTAGQTEDEERLQPRSDDEDTDFEEDCPCDWMEELEQMSMDH
ncbi:serine/threonine-protein kinase Nek3 isoform X5 [Oncorhynchus mykiss]|uniref:serine/threonine-protein kinase Nek3 isoform X5 n=1 Tax=Oncorhynchus mykiss TaxID=8022 RepID=UPI001878B861|nr:serine/threonine-protein kinase Nek3 isoform X5 [Oncorhynchus mykiss]